MSQATLNVFSRYLSLVTPNFQATPVQKTAPGPIPGGSRARGAGLQAGRHHHLHRLQSLRSRLPRMERSTAFATTTVFDNSNQTMPQTAWNYWNLIKFNEHETGRRHA
jgi:hypothetical protein